MDTPVDSIESPLYVGLDIGGTKVEAWAVDGKLQLQGKAVAPTRSDDFERVLASIREAVDGAIAETGMAGPAIAAIGGGVPGQVDHATGVVRHAVNLNLVHEPLGERLASHYGCPVVLENDVRLGAFGAFHYLRRHDPARFRGLNSLAYISIGTGLAVGLVINGCLYRGSRGMAGELGHVQVEPDGPRCNCGGYGCAEQYISGPGLARLARHRLADFPASSLHETEGAVSARTIFEAAARGDRAALALVDQFSGWIARLLFNVVLAYDVAYLVLGGGITKAGPVLLDAVFRRIDLLRADLPLAQILLEPEQVAVIPDQNMGIWGGITLAAEARLNRSRMTKEADRLRSL
jgi:glucokinase